MLVLLKLKTDILDPKKGANLELRLQLLLTPLGGKPDNKPPAEKSL